MFIFGSLRFYDGKRMKNVITECFNIFYCQMTERVKNHFFYFQQIEKSNDLQKCSSLYLFFTRLFL